MLVSGTNTPERWVLLRLRDSVLALLSFLVLI